MYPYREAQRALQDRFDSRRLADRINERLVKTELDGADRALIAGVDMFFVATADRDGQPSCSYKGGEPGFVHVLDAKTLAYPVWDGNGMFVSLGNLSENPRVGLLFIDFAKQARLRVEGRAELDAALAERWPECALGVRVHVAHVYPNCGRYVHKLQVEKRSRYVPRAGSEAPEPAWKREEWAKGVLPKKE